MPINHGMLSSRTDVWETPLEVFELLDSEFHFEVDVCALPSNAKCARFYTPEEDGLKQEWKGINFCNPPYGRTIHHWLEKSYQSSLKGATVVCLVPCRTCTSWWHDYAMKGEIRFIRGRLRFGSATSAAPFPSAIVIFRPRWWETRHQRNVRLDAADLRPTDLTVPLDQAGVLPIFERDIDAI